MVKNKNFLEKNIKQILIFHFRRNQGSHKGIDILCERQCENQTCIKLQKHINSSILYSDC